ncbi:hypothetical protein H5410_060309 [Solanum commersonii]|uniref:Uncharacterized protein n=1 Tax=Solanum commersonii TaxID=4109 RepID=A0A9J5W598_SOLCO|nr:hypothetical protein H5410_060309 [Solanum commersonii]
MKRIEIDDDELARFVEHSEIFHCWGVAGATSRIARAPLDWLKVGLQVQTSRASISSTIQEIWKDGGAACFKRDKIDDDELAHFVEHVDKNA